MRMPGAGLLLSQDGGTHWQMLNTNFARTSFSHIVVNPLNSGHLTVATVRGGLAGIRRRSLRASAMCPTPRPAACLCPSDGGTNFTRMLPAKPRRSSANPNNFNEQYAGLGEIYGDPTNGVYRTYQRLVRRFQLLTGSLGRPTSR